MSSYFCPLSGLFEVALVIERSRSLLTVEPCRSIAVNRHYRSCVVTLPETLDVTTIDKGDTISPIFVLENADFSPSPWIWLRDKSELGRKNLLCTVIKSVQIAVLLANYFHCKISPFTKFTFYGINTILPHIFFYVNSSVILFPNKLNR